MKRVVAVLGLFGTLALSQTPFPPGFYYWSHQDLAKMTNDLAPRMDAHKFKSQTIATENNHRFLITHREARGEAEYHEKESDIVFVQSGHAVLTIGGAIVGGKVTAPGEIRGDSITGGEEKDLNPGDVVVIPVKTPHQFTPKPQEAFNYFVVKVTETEKEQTSPLAN